MTLYGEILSPHLFLGGGHEITGIWGFRDTAPGL